MCSQLVPEDGQVDANHVAGAVTTVSKKSAFSRAVELARSASAPAILEVADEIKERLGGTTTIARMMVSDFNAVREYGPLGGRDEKLIQRYYRQIFDLFSKRDEMLQSEGEDPFATMSDEDLTVIAGETAKLRVATDPDFRMEILDQILEVDRELLESYFLTVFCGIPMLKTPSVKVADP